MYKTNFGISFIIALFGAIFMMLPLLAYLQLSSRKWRTASFVYGMPDRNSGFSFFKKPDPSLAPDDYIRAFFLHMAKASLKWMNAILLCAREVYTYELFSEDQMSQSRLLSLNGVESWSLDDIEYVELGCNLQSRHWKKRL